MNRPFNPTSPLLRFVCACAAVLAMLVTGGAIVGLAEHYSAASQMASMQSVVIARR